MTQVPTQNCKERQNILNTMCFQPCIILWRISHKKTIILQAREERLDYISARNRTGFLSNQLVAYSFGFLTASCERLENSGEFETDTAADKSWAFLEAASLRMCFSWSNCIMCRICLNEVYM